MNDMTPNSLDAAQLAMVNVSVNDGASALEYATKFREGMLRLVRGSRGIVGGQTRHMIAYDYSHILPKGQSNSGADLWERVTMLGGMSGYYIPTAEGQIVDQNAAYFRNMFARQPTIIDLGPGGDHALNLKSLPTMKAVGGAHYIAIDINKDFAARAAQTVAEKMQGVTTSFLHADFTTAPDLGELQTPILMMMYGNTLSQFPLSKHAKPKDVSFCNLLDSLGRMTDHKAVFAATVDTNTYGPSARDCYNGRHFTEFKINFWRTAKHLIEFETDKTENYLRIKGNPNIDIASAFLYNPNFKDGEGIIHSYVAMTDVEIAINGQHFDIRSGETFETGESAKWHVSEIAAEARKFGWLLADELTDGRSTVKELIFVGKNVVSASDEMALLGSNLARSIRRLPGLRTAVRPLQMRQARRKGQEKAYQAA